MNERLLRTNVADVQALLCLDFSNQGNIRSLRKAIAGVDIGSLNTTERFQFTQIVRTAEKLIACAEGVTPKRVDSRVRSAVFKNLP